MDEDKTAETENDPVSSQDEYEEAETIIRDTDIVFDCPHCGHNLAIDYRGAGLQISCVNCGEDVLVPIPDGMNISDLDLDAGEILKQLFATRRNLRKAEMRADSLAAELAAMTESRDALEASLAALGPRAEEMRSLCLQQGTIAAKLAELIDGISGSSEPDAAE